MDLIEFIKSIFTDYTLRTVTLGAATLGAALLLENRVALLSEYGATLVAGITFFAFLYSAWLVYVQAMILEAFCPWCLTHEVVITILFIISGLR